MKIQYRAIIVLPAIALIALVSPPSAAAPSQNVRQRPLTKSGAKKQLAKECKSRTPKMTQLNDLRFYTFGMRPAPNVRAPITRDPLIAQVKGAQSGMELHYDFQNPSRDAKAVETTGSRGTERKAFASAANWQTGIVDQVGAHDDPNTLRTSHVAPIVLPVGTPVRVRGVRSIVMRAEGNRKARVLKHKTNTVYGFAKPLPRTAHAIQAPQTSPLLAGAQIAEGAGVGRMIMTSAIVGSAAAPVNTRNVGLTLPKRPKAGERMPDGAKIPTGMGWVNALNFAAVLQGSTVEVINLSNRSLRTKFVAGARNEAGNSNRGQLLAKPGARLALIATLPSGGQTLQLVTVPSRRNLPEVLIEGHYRVKGKANKARRQRHDGKKTATYYRSQVASALDLRISPAMTCKGCAKKSAHVSIIRLPDRMLAGEASVKNMTTGEVIKVNLAEVGEVAIAAETNQRLYVTLAPRGGKVTHSLYLVPGEKDGKQLEVDETTGRRFYQPKPAPAR